MNTPWIESLTPQELDLWFWRAMRERRGFQIETRSLEPGLGYVAEMVGHEGFHVGLQYDGHGQPYHYAQTRDRKIKQCGPTHDIAVKRLFVASVFVERTA